MLLDPIALAAMLALLLVAALVLWWLYRSRRTSGLRDRFGATEYDRTLERHGARAKAEADLIDRQKRVAELAVRPLTSAEHLRFSEKWSQAKARFVDDPAVAVTDADGVLGAVMEARGYPVDDFDARFESLTVDHANVARHYRAGHDIAVRQRDNKASTEDLRQAMIHYEALFGELTSDAETADGPAPKHTEVAAPAA